jgi:tetratricopeptide (TPR) repeat protein
LRWNSGQEALDTANKALELDRQYPDSWFNKAASEERLGKKRDALESYKQFIRLAPPGPQRTDAENRKRSLELELGGVNK